MSDYTNVHVSNGEFNKFKAASAAEQIVNDIALVATREIFRLLESGAINPGDYEHERYHLGRILAAVALENAMTKHAPLPKHEGEVKNLRNI